jgi:hypothetical protein
MSISVAPAGSNAFLAARHNQYVVGPSDRPVAPSQSTGHVSVK